MADSDMMGLEDLLKHGLKDMYYAETKIQKSLPKMIKAAQDPDLVAALETHLEETADQIARLEEAFDLMGEKAKAEKCDAMDGILAEGDSLLKDFGGSPAGDAAIIFSCQAVEHYEIARYGTLCRWAKLLDMGDAARLLESTLKEEGATDEALTKLADKSVNKAALAA